MAKIFYAVGTKAASVFPIRYLDGQGVEQKETVEAETVMQARQQFEKDHPGAKCISLGELFRRQVQIADERAKLAWWNARAGK